MLAKIYSSTQLAGCLKTHTPAVGMLAEALEGWCNHRAHMELVMQQVWVPRQTPGARHRGTHQPSVTCAPAVIALCLRLCTHIHTHTNCVRNTQLNHVSNPQCSMPQVCKQYQSNQTTCNCGCVIANLFHSHWNLSEQVSKISLCINSNSYNNWGQVSQLAHVFACYH